jgi:hypothetical protein
MNYMLMNGQILITLHQGLGGGGEAYRVDRLLSEQLRSQMRSNPHTLFFLV